MICFGAKTDQEVKEKGICRSHFKKKKIKKEANSDRRGCVRKKKGEIFLFFFYFLSFLSSIYGNRTVEIRRGKKKSVLLDDGYA